MDRPRNMHQRKSSRKRCLSDLYRHQKGEVFKDITAEDTPQGIRQFIDQQGYGDSAVVKKLFKNSESYLKIFAFQYLTLCFHSNEEICLNYQQLIYELIEKEQFEFLLPSAPHQIAQQTHMSLKNIISQYMNHMSESSDTVFKSWEKYPLIMDIFIAFFKTMLYLGDVCTADNQELQTISKEEIYQFLTSYFEVEAVAIKQFVIFKESKISIFQCSGYSDQIFVIYLEDPIYKIDDSKFSSMLNRKEQTVYKSGISSVKCLISNIQIKSHQEIELADKKQTERSDRSKQISMPHSQIIIQCQDSSKDFDCNQKSTKKCAQIQNMEPLQSRNREQNTISNAQVKPQIYNQLINNRVITEESSQMYSESGSFQSQKKGLGNYLKNLVNLEPKNVSYSIGQESSTIRMHDSINNYKRKNKNISAFSNSKQNIIPQNCLEDSQNKLNFNKQNIRELRKIECNSPSGSTSKVRSIIDKYQFEQYPISRQNLQNETMIKQKNSIVQTVKQLKNKNEKQISNFEPYVPKLNSVFKKSNFQKITYSKQNKDYQEANLKWKAKLDITKQFTNSFVLLNVCQPYKSSIQDVKKKVRTQRKNARMFLI